MTQYQGSERRHRGIDLSSIRRLAAVIETASNRVAWSLSRIGLAGSRASLARASTSFARRPASSSPSSHPRCAYPRSGCHTLSQLGAPPDRSRSVPKDLLHVESFLQNEINLPLLALSSH